MIVKAKPMQTNWTKESTAVTQQQDTHKEATMNRLIIAKMYPERYTEELTPEQQAAARFAARSLFGYRYQSSEFQPTAGIPFNGYLASIQRNQPDDTGAGWIAVVSDEVYTRLQQFLNDQKEFGGLFDIKTIHLNDDASTIDVYCNTSPHRESSEECWGTGGGS
jgi:hypothetical protein